jgi:hypothetical protein
VARSVSLLLRVSPHGDLARGGLKVYDVDTERPLPLFVGALILSLTNEPGAGHARGWLHTPDRAFSCPIQTSAALFEALAGYVEAAGRDAPSLEAV